MKTGRCFMVMGGLILMLTLGTASAQMDDLKKDAVLTAIDSRLKDKVLQTGTLDLYDEKADTVRNLRLLKKSDEVSEQGGKYSTRFAYRDIHSGDIVTVEIEARPEGGDYSLERVAIKDVQKWKDAEEQPSDKEFTDEEIQTFMKEYIGQQTQFTDGKLMLYDKDGEKMRNLELKELNSEVRRMGILYSSGSQFGDIDSGEILDIDISVQKKNGRLDVQALRIRDVHKGMPASGL